MFYWDLRAFVLNLVSWNSGICVKLPCIPDLFPVSIGALPQIMGRPKAEVQEEDEDLIKPSLLEDGYGEFRLQRETQEEVGKDSDHTEEKR
jgi:hypothetical protein